MSYFLQIITLRAIRISQHRLFYRTMTTANFRFIEPSSYDAHATKPFEKPWNKVDGPGFSYGLTDRERTVIDLRGHESEFTMDNSGFSVHKFLATESVFTDENQVRTSYYSDIERLLREKLLGVKKVVIFDHTIRRRTEGSSRAPVQLVHVDQTPSAAEARVFRHLPEEEARHLSKGRYQIVNVWRPIQNVASDYPLAVVDWRSTRPFDFVAVDLLYPKDFQEGGEVAPDSNSAQSTEGYEVRGEQYAIAPNENHRFHYVKDMTPKEVMLIKCFDSKSSTMTGGKTDIAHGACHSAFCDPNTSPEAPKRQSIEVRCLVFYD